MKSTLATELNAGVLTFNNCHQLQINVQPCTVLSNKLVHPMLVVELTGMRLKLKRVKIQSLLSNNILLGDLN
jgi:hypothetical protein